MIYLERLNIGKAANLITVQYNTCHDEDVSLSVHVYNKWAVCEACAVYYRQKTLMRCSCVII